MPAARNGRPKTSESLVLGEIALAISRADEASEAIQRTAEAVQRHFRTLSLGIWLGGGEKHLTLEALVMPDAYGASAETISDAYQTVSLDSDLPGPAAMRARAPLRYSREEASLLDSDLPEVMDALDASSLVAIPILMEDQALGCAVLTQTGTRQLTPEQEEFLMDALGLIAIVFHRVRLLERDQERSLRLRTLAMAVEHLPSMVKIMSPEWEVRWVNPAVRDVLGYEPEDLVGLRIEDLRQDGGPESVQRQIEESLQAGVWSGEVLDRHQDGRVVPMRSTVVPVRDPAGALAAIVEMERDLTEERAQHARIEEAYRLAAVGELAAGVAHEVNNPLQAVISTAELLLLDDLSDAVRSDVETMKMEAKRGGVIVRNLLTYARPRPPAPAPIDLNEVVESVIHLRAAQIRLQNIALDVELAPRPAWVSADADQIKQVIHNLLGNAAQAVNEVGAGTIRIQVREVDGAVEVICEDTGPGIPEEILTKIFRPFFTTKEVGKGTGLGLSVSQKLVRENGGELEARSWGRTGAARGRPGEGGARFIIRLPSLPAEERHGEGVSEDSEPRPRVLIVEDEPTIAGVAVRYLERSGCEADFAPSAEEALEMVRRRRAFDVVFLDLKMAGMGGEGFYREVKDRHPEILDRLIFTSGDIVSPATREFLESTGRPVLEKPYALNDLVEWIEAVASGELPSPPGQP